MKKIALLSFVIFATNCFADELHHFSEIRTAAVSGKQIHIVVDIAKCSAAKIDARDVHMPTGVFTPTELQAFDNRIVTSFTHFTLTNPGFPNKPVYEFVRFAISDDNSVAVSAQTLDAHDYSPLGEKKSFTCKLDDSARIYS